MLWSTRWLHVIDSQGSVLNGRCNCQFAMPPATWPAKNTCMFWIASAVACQSTPYLSSHNAECRCLNINTPHCRFSLVSTVNDQRPRAKTRYCVTIVERLLESILYVSVWQWMQPTWVNHNISRLNTQGDLWPR